jgi:hypothetical protein
MLGLPLPGVLFRNPLPVVPADQTTPNPAVFVPRDGGLRQVVWDWERYGVVLRRLFIVQLFPDQGVRFVLKPVDS